MDYFLKPVPQMIESISKHIGNIVVVDNPTVFLQSTLEHSDKELV